MESVVMKRPGGAPGSPPAREVDVEVSLVIPCYDEESVLPISIPPLLDLCGRVGLLYEVILVDNGSTDSTAEVIDSFVSQGYPVRRVDVPVNQGYGWGVISGLREATGRYVGHLCADGQIAAEDVVRTYWAIRGTERRTLAKVRRVNRGDGWLRRGVSCFYNTAFTVMYGRITPDVNGTPKFFHREDLQLLSPLSKDNFIDAELMIKAKATGFRVLEIPAVFLKRGGGSSKVAVLKTSLEFMKNLLSFRRSSEFKSWVQRSKDEQQ